MPASAPPAPEPAVRSVHHCRVCDQRTLDAFLDLGAQPPANALLDEVALAELESRFPLALAACRTCELIQLTHVVAPEILFRHYMYFSSVSAVMTRHFAEYATDVADRFVPSGGLVVEIGSNDGRAQVGQQPMQGCVEVRRLLGDPLAQRLEILGHVQCIAR